MAESMARLGLAVRSSRVVTPFSNGRMSGNQQVDNALTKRRCWCGLGTRARAPLRHGDDMTGWQIIGAAMIGYLLLLARSAWKQGEFLQFLRSLAIVALLIGGVAGVVAAAIALDSP